MTTSPGLNRILGLLLSLLIYLVGCTALVGLILFIGNWFLPRTMDTGPASPLGEALLVNLSILGLFAVQHTIMARRGFKRWVTRYVPEHLERSLFVLAAGLIVLLLLWQWRPLPQVIWSVQNPLAAGVLTALCLAGWTLLFVSTFLFNHFELFGLEQSWRNLQGRPEMQPEFKTPSLYRLVRHPMMTGVLLAIWATPHMSLGHLVLSLTMTAYVLIGVQIEERDLIKTFGRQYEEYRETTPMLLPIPRRAKLARETAN